VQQHVQVFNDRLASYPDWPELEDLGACPVVDVPTTDRPLPDPHAGA
jgi:glutathione-regulated potassium-efflux system ancillary protein KefF